MTIAGKMHYRCNGQGTVRGGDICIIRPGAVHSSWTEEEDTEECVVHLDAALLLRLENWQTWEPCLVLRPKEEEWTPRSLARLVPDDLVTLESRLLSLIATYTSSAPPKIDDPRIALAISKMSDSLSRPWSVAELAKCAAMSPANFTRQFRNLMGEPPKAYLISLRLCRAEWLMTSSSQSLSTIAQQVGFGSSSRLSEAFKKKNGISPSEWRTANHQGHDGVDLL